MFGFVLPDKPEMKVKEYEQFRAVYCGVCKAIAKRHGTIPRFVLNYDMTFLAVLLSSALDNIPEMRTERCIAHPVTKRLTAKQSSVLDYVADMNVLLAYYKLLDDWSDERSLKAIPAMAGLLKAYRKVKKVHPQKDKAVKHWLSELSKLEKADTDNIDIVAEPFAKLMEELFICDSTEISESDSKILSWIGYNIGKWIYIIDAFSDIEKDYKSDSYNPFIAKTGKALSPEEIKAKVRGEVEFILVYTLSQVSQSYDLLKKGKFSPILENIIYLGMLRKTENILGIGSCGKIEKSV